MSRHHPRRFRDHPAERNTSRRAAPRAVAEWLTARFDSGWILSSRLHARANQIPRSRLQRALRQAMASGEYGGLVFVGPWPRDLPSSGYYVAPGWRRRRIKRDREVVARWRRRAR